MKRRDLIKRISGAASAAGLSWEVVATSKRGDHEKWRLGSAAQVSIPRHREINEITAQSILRETERALGQGWWR